MKLGLVDECPGEQGVTFCRVLLYSRSDPLTEAAGHPKSEVEMAVLARVSVHASKCG